MLVPIGDECFLRKSRFLSLPWIYDDYNENYQNYNERKQRKQTKGFIKRVSFL